MSLSPQSPHYKFRPSLSLAEIEYLISVSTGHSVQAKLNLCKLKAEAGLIKPSHTRNPKVPLLDSLGIDYESRESVQLALLEHWLSHNPREFTRAELDQILEYRFTHDLMTTSEEIAYQNYIISNDPNDLTNE